MPTWCFSRAHLKGYKGIFIFIFLFAVLKYFFMTGIDYHRPAFLFNTTRFHEDIKDVDQMHGPLLQKLLSKNKLYQNNSNTTTSSTTPATLKRLIVNDLNYIVTLPPIIAYENSNATLPNVTAALELSTIESIENNTVLNITQISTTILPFCPDITSNLLGRVSVIKSPVPNVMDLEKRLNWLLPGGHWTPTDCAVNKQVAIVIPFRNRGQHLLLFLQHMHPFLKRQQLDYTIFVVEQDGNGPFNRAMLMNIGYVEGLKRKKFSCFIFHDIDLLPEDDRNLYSCPEQPRHMSVAVDIFKYRLPYPAIFGGVSAITSEHFKLLNGFSNSFWGWGGEDDDMSNRIRYHHLFISRYPITIARYTMLTHKKDTPNPTRFDILRAGMKKFESDGLNTLKYNVVQSKQNLLYTWILVAIEVPTS